MRSDLKEKSVLYVSSLKSLEDEIKEQENEIKRLQARDEVICLSVHSKEHEINVNVFLCTGS